MKYYRAIMKRGNHTTGGCFQYNSLHAWDLQELGFFSKEDSDFYKYYLFDEAFEWLKVPPALVFERHKHSFCVFTEEGYEKAKDIIELANAMLEGNPRNFHLEWIEYDNLDEKYMTLYKDNFQLVVEEKHLKRELKKKKLTRKAKKKMRVA